MAAYGTPLLFPSNLAGEDEGEGDLARTDADRLASRSSRDSGGGKGVVT